MFKTKMTEILGVQYPIVGGTMMSITDAKFTAAISNAGALGVLASAIYQTRESFGEALDELLELTNRPFAVNLNLFPMMRPIDNNDYLDVLLEKGVKIVETSGHSAPADLCARFKEAGLIWIHKCVGIRYALKVQEMGADMITVVGYENGGATGKLDVGTLVLVPRAVESLSVPVIGGGGVSDGRGLVAVLALGAQAVIIGTRLLATQEAPIHERLKEALVNASELDTMLVMRSIGATHRVWNNRAANRILELEKNQADLPEILNIAAGEKARKMYREGDLDAGIISCGQGIGMVHDIPTVKELFDRMMDEAMGIARRLVAD
ncbi:MAG: nitronate monooxygenase [Deltaproteobacteria bacterium]|nr:nitronate monooxygenase [Deltaproteobacteria bacterium]MBW2047913.1 nitronate monooxygenase [Deltaproteobacteria bacterium]MBW2110295.1 nitronate monooxygenase [Deltaproteobacteria bacterium]MBW2352072.1 nitronate monooxygenase [Deltaproteobacteria bacterium]